MIKIILVFSFLALVAYNAIVFARTPGTMAERLSAAWRDSMTIFVGVWGGLLSVIATCGDALAALTGDPQFAQLADSVKAVIPAQYHPLIPIGVIGGTMLARLRTLGK